MIRAVVLAMWLGVAALVGLVAWFLITTGPLGTCVPGAHPAVTLERCAKVQP